MIITPGCVTNHISSANKDEFVIARITDENYFIKFNLKKNDPQTEKYKTRDMKILKGILDY